ncbi:hypothetical protein NIES2098_00270 [Calothrix sp. NIES-2098]|nr:hypothetical protein NIES2098_00270 [Calothrix sp. NIES-2098]
MTSDRIKTQRKKTTPQNATQPSLAASTPNFTPPINTPQIQTAPSSTEELLLAEASPQNLAEHDIGRISCQPHVRPTTNLLLRQLDENPPLQSDTPQLNNAQPAAKNPSSGSTTIQNPPTLQHNTYHGKNLDEVANNLPDEAGSVDFNFKVTTQGDPITQANLNVTQVMTMPRWAERNKQCPPVQQSWDNFYSALKNHEDGHVAIDNKEFPSAHQRFIGKATSDVTSESDALRAKVQAVHDQYDTTTDHGRKQTPPTEIDLSAECSKKAEKTSSSEEPSSETVVMAKTSGHNFSQIPVLRPQLGNFSGQVMLIQRQTPDAGTANNPGLSPEDARRLMYARTTLKETPPLDEGSKATLNTAMKDATAFTLIQERDKKGEELKQKTEQLEQLKRDIQDYSGRTPEVEAKEAQRDLLSNEINALTADFENQKKMVEAVLKSLNVEESQLVKLVTEDFPNMFVNRGKQIALVQLRQNRELAQKEADKYKDICTEAGDNGPQKREGLRNAAKDLTARTKEIENLQLQLREAHKDLPPGGVPEPEQASSSAYDLAHESEIQQRIEQKQNELKAQKSNYALKYQILLREDIDVEKLATASDAELTSIVGGKIDEILENIRTTEDNISQDKLRIWQLNDIVGMTKQDLGIDQNPTLSSVINTRIQKEQQIKADEKSLEDGLKAFAITAGIIASIVTLNPGIAIAVGTVVSAIDVVEKASTYSKQSAASDVGLDPAIAKMSAEDPQLIWLIIAIADFAANALMLASYFKQLRQAATTLEAFSKAATKVLPQEQAQKLIDIAKRNLKQGLNIAEQIEAVGAAFRDVDRAKVGLVLARYTNEAYTATFLELTQQGKILPMTEEAIRQAIKNEAQATTLVGKYINNPNLKAGGFYEPSTRTVFIAGDTSVNGVAGTVVHELTHHFQRITEASIISNQIFYAEYQAHLMQQKLIQKVAADYGNEVIPEASRWLINADDAEIAAKITQRYRVSPDPEIGLNRLQQEEIIQQMVDMRMKGIDRKQQLMEKLRQKVER